MSSAASLPSRPKLAPGVRLHQDTRRAAWVLLAPERVFELEGPARDIVERCDGTRAVAQIIDELAAIYAAGRDEISADVIDMLAALQERGMIV